MVCDHHRYQVSDFNKENLYELLSQWQQFFQFHWALAAYTERGQIDGKKVDWLNSLTGHFGATTWLVGPEQGKESFLKSTILLNFLMAIFVCFFFQTTFSKYKNNKCLL